VLPCADCEGIKTRLTLAQDGTYTLSETYQGKSEQAQRSEGRFTWNSKGTVITLQGIATGARTTQFQVGENQLWQLDMNGAKIEGDLAPRYILKKAMADALAGSHWRLIELAGQPVEGNPESHFLKFDGEGRVAAKAGCNNMMGSYQSDAPGRIQFTKMAMTMMACMDMSQEQALAAALERADNYTMGEDSLSLNKARMAPLARFERVK
jgi:copper homeostasis protein (lipoprotein)